MADKTIRVYNPHSQVYVDVLYHDNGDGTYSPVGHDAAALAMLGATSGAAVVSDAAGTLQQYLRGLIKILAALWITAINALRIYSAPNPQTPTAHRTNITAADVMAVPGTVTCTKQAGGACADGEYKVKVVAVNAHGRTTATAGNATVTTETTNLTVRAAFAQVVGATHYDVYCSTDVDPKWVGRITEAERASGIKITAVGVTGEGGTAGAVDVEVVGTGLAAGTTAAVNTAWVIPASPVDCSGYTYIDFDITASCTGDAVAPALSVAPFFVNSRDSTYYQGTETVMTFGGTTGEYDSRKQRLRVECRGCSGVALLVRTIAGTGMSVNIDAIRS